MVKRYLPGYILLERIEKEEYFRLLTMKWMPGYHLAKNPPKGPRKPKDLAPTS